MPIAAGSNCRLDRQPVWRVCEGQTKYHTWALVDGNTDELDLLESILDRSKGAVPDALAGFHPLLYTAFRYVEQTPTGSRFVRHGAGCALYGAFDPETCFFEAGFWASRFVAASEGLQAAPIALRRCLFQFAVGGAAIDLTQAPYLAARADWVQPGDYGECQALGSYARRESIPLIVYESVRDPQQRRCVVVMLSEGLAAKMPLAMQEWDLLLSTRETVWTNRATGERMKAKEPLNKHREGA